MIKSEKREIKQGSGENNLAITILMIRMQHLNLLQLLRSSDF